MWLNSNFNCAYNNMLDHVVLGYQFFNYNEFYKITKKTKLRKRY